MQEPRIRVEEGAQFRHVAIFSRGVKRRFGASTARRLAVAPPAKPRLDQARHLLVTAISGQRDEVVAVEPDPSGVSSGVEQDACGLELNEVHGQHLVMGILPAREEAWD